MVVGECQVYGVGPVCARNRKAGVGARGSEEGKA